MKYLLIISSVLIFSTTAWAVDLSKVTLRVALVGWNNTEVQVKAAGADNTPYKVEYFVFQGGNLSLQAIAAGQIDLAGSSEIPPIFSAQAANGGNFKVVAISNSSTLEQELVIPKGSTIRRPADLKGKRVGYISATTAQYFLLKILESAGLAWTDIEAVPISTSDGVTALIGGKIDAFASYGLSIQAAHNKGATTLVSAVDILSGNFPYNAAVTALADPGKRAAIVDFLARIERANVWAAKNPEKWAQLSARQSGQTYEERLKDLQDQNAQRLTKTIVPSKASIASQQDVADAFLKVGLLKARVDVAAFTSFELNDELTKALATVK